jgi:hypothetical protein
MLKELATILLAATATTSALAQQPPDWYFAQIEDSQWMTFGQTAPPSFAHFANMTWQMTRWNPRPRRMSAT